MSDFRPLVGNLRLVLLFLVPLWLGSALEELVYRGYLMNRVADIGGGSPGSWLVSLVVHAVLLVCLAVFGWRTRRVETAIILSPPVEEVAAEETVEIRP